MAFALGSTAESIVLTSSGFILIFYNQVLGAPAASIGVALSAGIVLNALFDPFIGSWSDRTRSRLGRRHPFMFAAILPTALAFLAVFNPPAALSGFGLMVWLCLFNILLQQAMAIFHTPHLAFGGELSDDYIERSNVMSFNTLFLWLGDTTGWLLSFAVFFRASPGFPNGALNPAVWPRFSLTVACIVIAAMGLSAWFTRRRIPYLPQATPDTPRLNVREFGRDIGRALSNRNYVMLLIGYFFFALMSGVRTGLWLYGATFFWRLTAGQVSFFALGSFAGYLFGSVVVTRLHRRFDKRVTAMVAFAVYCIGPALPLALGWFGVLSADTPFLLPILIAFSLLQHAPFSIMTTTIYSALADIADENELRFGIRQEGILYSTRTLFSKIDQAIGTALAGWVLSAIAFPQKAKVGEVPEPVLMALAAAFVISTIPGLVGAVFYGRIAVSRSSYAATKAALRARGAPIDAAVETEIQTPL